MDKVLVDHQIKVLVKNKNISCDYIKLEEFIQPSSIDIPLGNIAYNIKRSINPIKTKVKGTLDGNIIETIDLTKGAVFRKHNIYLVPTININFSKSLYAKCSPKSSIGRIDVLVRTLVDNLGFYDSVSNNTKSIIWLEIIPQSFNIKVKTGIPMTQLKIFKLDNSTDTSNSIKVNKINQEFPFLDKHHEALSVFIGNKLNTGYIAKDTNEILDLESRDLNIKDFFDPITDIKEHSTLLIKNKFYIMRTSEKIAIPKIYSGEMLPYSNVFGELRAHYAGYFDPGFGTDEQGNRIGNYGVLEIRPFENIEVKNGQPVCLMRYLYNDDIPNKIYGLNNNNYTSQSKVRLAKFFKSN